MLKQLDCRQEDPKTSQQCWGSGLPSSNLPAAQWRQQIAQGNHLLVAIGIVHTIWSTHKPHGS
jgi:hypothetical protein